MRSTCLSFFFNDTATTEIYTLSLHDALPILIPVNIRFIAKHVLKRIPFLGWYMAGTGMIFLNRSNPREAMRSIKLAGEDRKSTRLNSSHANISYAVFCLKKKKTHCQLSSLSV